MDTASQTALTQRAAATHVVVVGAGISGLVAARTFAKVGMQVTVLEAETHAGGTIRRAELDGVTLDAGADSYSVAGGHVGELIDELGLSGEVVVPDPLRTWIGGLPGGRMTPVPEKTLLGIPENPFAEEVRRAIGWKGAWRAYVDRLRPPLTIGHEQRLGRLVTSRMGERVRDRLVAPLSEGVYSIPPDEIDTDVAAPGLNAALTRTGSLSGAVATVRAEREEPLVRSIAGGMSRLVDALVADLRLLGVELRTQAQVAALSRAETGWITHLSASEDPADAVGAAADTETETEVEIASDAVVLATDEATAHALIAPAVSSLGDPAAVPLETITLLVDAPALDEAPRGAGVVTVPGSGPAQAVWHQTATWSGLRAQTSPRHVLRVVFGSSAHRPATAELSDADAAEVALEEAATHLGLTRDELVLVAAQRERFVQAPPASALGSAERQTRVRAAVESVPGLAVVGAWVSGTGLARVIPDAVATAERLRGALLWTDREVHPPATDF